MHIVEVRTIDIVKDLMSSDFLAATSGATYMRYITADKMVMRHLGALSLPVKLSKNALAAERFGIRHLDDSRLYIFSEKNTQLMMKAASAFVKKDRKYASFYANYFHIDGMALSEKLSLRPLE